MTTSRLNLSESVPSSGPDVQTEPEFERPDDMQYESLEDKVGRNRSCSAVESRYRGKIDAVYSKKVCTVAC